MSARILISSVRAGLLGLFCGIAIHGLQRSLIATVVLVAAVNCGDYVRLSRTEEKQ